MIKNKRYSLIVYSFAHLVVDLSCLYWLFNHYYQKDDMIIVFLGYNILAFGLQVVVGYFCDHYPQLNLSVVGLAFILVALWLDNYFGLLLVGIGNAMFHVYAGIDSLKYSQGKIARSGFFVSFGAIGVSIGSFLGMKGFSLVPYLLLVGALLLVVLIKYDDSEVSSYDLCNKANPYLIVILILIGIATRSFATGYVTKVEVYFLLPALFAGAGKLLGGILADHFGSRLISCLSIILALLMLNINWDVSYLLGLMFVNMTMPITLCGLASIFKHNYGLAFGLTTLALLFGSFGQLLTLSNSLKSILLIGMLVVTLIINYKTFKGGKKNVC